MLEIIVLAACLIASPDTCRRVELQVAPENGASLQLPFHCFRQGQIEGQKWIAANPEWRIARWSCPPAGKMDRKI